MSFSRENMNVHNKPEVADTLLLLFKKKKKQQPQSKNKQPHNTNLLPLNSNIHRKDTATWTHTKRGNLALFMFSQLQASPGSEMRLISFISLVLC